MKRALSAAILMTGLALGVTAEAAETARYDLRVLDVPSAGEPLFDGKPAVVAVFESPAKLDGGRTLKAVVRDGVATTSFMDGDTGYTLQVKADGSSPAVIFLGVLTYDQTPYRITAARFEDVHFPSAGAVIVSAGQITAGGEVRDRFIVIEPNR